MELSKKNDRTSQDGPAEVFTGTVRIEPMFAATEPGRVHGSEVTFEPEARSAWHTHPLGQTLIVTSGKGWVQSEGQPKVELNPCDVVSCPPNEKHWHGACPDSAMSHIAIQEALDGKMVEWMEKVTDEEYLA